MKIKILLLILLSICSFIQLYGQDREKLDSLWNAFKQAKHDTTRIKILNEEIGYRYENYCPDSAIMYYNQAISIADKSLAGPPSSLPHTAEALYLLKSKSLRYIGLVHSDQGNYDKAIENYLKALKIDEVILSKAKNLSDKQSAKKGMSACYNNIGLVHSYQGSYDKAIENYLKALKINEELGDKKGMSDCYTNIGVVYYNQGNYDKAIENYLKSLKIDEELGDKKGISQCYNNIGLVHYDQGSYDKAIENFLKSLKIKEELGDKKGMSSCYTNIGNVHSDQGSSQLDKKIQRDKYDKAIEYYLKALKIKEELGDKKGMSYCYNNIGNVHFDQGSYDKAIENYLKSLKIKEELGDKNGIVACYINLGSLNSILADSAALTENQKLNYLNKAVEFGTKAIKLAQEINAMPREKEAASTLMNTYKKLGNFKKAMEFAEIFISTQDSMFSEEKTKALAEMTSRYEAEKKQLLIEKMQKQKELDHKTMEAQTAENRKQQIVIFSTVGGFIIVLVFSIIILRMFRQKRKANILLATQNAEIKQQKEEISTQRDEIRAQRDLVTHQKEHIEEIHKEVTDSINYAKRIQEAVLPVSVNARAVLGEHFILFKPKDIVSGDFYWTTKLVSNKQSAVHNMPTADLLIVAVADCTGHGVPGAFMSMLGISFLNEIVRKQEVTQANHVLNELRKEGINALQQKGVSGEQKDGMDISLLVVNTETYECQWAGANNPLYIVSSKQSAVGSKTEDCGLIEIKGDKMPIAIHPIMNDFTNHQFKVEKGDCLYLFSDGYADQFGGPKGKKFMYKPLKELLLTNYTKSMEEQKQIIEKTINDWIGNNEQIDDITVIGIKI